MGAVPMVLAVVLLIAYVPETTTMLLPDIYK